MNRADWRRQARQRDRISQEIIHKAQQQLNDGRVEAMMEPWIRGECSLEDMQRQVREEIGIEIRC